MPTALSGRLSTQMCSGTSVEGRAGRDGCLKPRGLPAASPDCIRTIVGRQCLVARLMSGFIFLFVLSSGGCSRRNEEGPFTGSWTVLCKQVPPDSSEGAGGSYDISHLAAYLVDQMLLTCENILEYLKSQAFIKGILFSSWSFFPKWLYGLNVIINVIIFPWPSGVLYIPALTSCVNSCWFI